VVDDGLAEDAPPVLFAPTAVPAVLWLEYVLPPVVFEPVMPAGLPFPPPAPPLPLPLLWAKAAPENAKAHAAANKKPLMVLSYFVSRLASWLPGDEFERL
jgi:hypothetical protein